MKADENKTPPETAGAPRGELMKCPDCGGDDFAMGKSVIHEDQRYWRVPVRIPGQEEHGLRIEQTKPGYAYEHLHIVCRKCGATFWEGEILEMWKAGGWTNL